MDTTQGVQVPSARRDAAMTVILLGLSALLSAPAFAGIADANHRFERIGSGIADATAILAMPGEMRALVLQRNGDLRLVCGDGLVDQPLVSIPVNSDCPEKGLLSGVWAPDSVGQELFLTYVSEATGLFTVGKISFDAAMRPGALELVWQATTPPPCSNLGGGIAFAVDGTLLVGTGDFGNQAGAGQITQPVGKILRFTTTGAPPQAPLTPNPFGASPTYAMGCRNPVRLMADSASGVIWFLDLGPGDNDELNLVQVNTNYGWNGAQVMGRTGAPGDPHHVWSPAVGPAGLNAYRGTHFKNAGNIIVAASDGGISEVAVDMFNPVNSTESPLYTADLSGPQSFTDLTVLPDGMIYVIDENGSLWRLTDSSVQPIEPSNGSSIVPLLLEKDVTGQINVAIERQGVAPEYGLYVGDLMTLASDGYNHPDTPTQMLFTDLSLDDAWTRNQVSASQLNGVNSAYVLISGVSSRLETNLGFDSLRVQRPGGDVSFTCEDGCDLVGFGTGPGQCMQDMPLTLVMQDDDGDGVATNLGTLEATIEGDCKVTAVLLGAEWCPPCQAEAPHMQALVEQYGADRLEVISVLHQNSASAPADRATAERWIAAYGLTYKVVADPSASVIGAWNVPGPTCGGIPQSFLFDEQGKQVGFFCGYPNAMDALIETEMNN